MIRYRFVDKGTTIHRLNPFAKIAWVISIMILVMIFDHPVYLSLLLISTIPMIMMGKITGEWLSVFKYIIYMSVFIIIINALVMYRGSHVLVELPFRIPLLGTPRITLEAIFYGFMMSVRLLAIVSAFTVINLTVCPDDLLLAMIKMKLPYKSVLVTSMSTRFIPTLVDDMDRITDAHRTRGLEMDKGKLFARIKNRATILMPLLSNSLDRTIQIAEAMESRAFGQGRNRTFFKDIQITLFDWLTIAFGLLPLVIGILMRSRGYGSYQYYPVLEALSTDPTEWVLVALMLIILITAAPLSLLKRRIDLD